MAKDPACLWYWGDWAGGTATMTRHLKGCYMDVLNAQFNSGPLSLEEIKTVLGSDFGSSWPALQKKFILAATGLYYNERLQIEKEKRSAYVKSRKRNLDHPHMAPHKAKRMDPHTDNENENVIEAGNGRGGPEEREKQIAAQEEIFRRSFDERTMEGYGMAFKGVNLQQELTDFKLKVCNAWKDYQHRDVGGIRSAFQFQLRQARERAQTQINGTVKSTSKKQQHTADLVAAHTRKYGGGAEHRPGAEGNIQVDGAAT
jgi:hypothetical protein